ncbi:MAG: hypothetical protein IPK13_20815 [Deltaproteobacteria bacterium]|nr:hypothetical protein [Deltaproteobacteria bacterium]
MSINTTLQAAFDVLLASEPSMTFFEAQTELVQRGAVEYAKAQDLAVHAELFRYFQRAKEKATAGRFNAHL